MRVLQTALWAGILLFVAAQTALAGPASPSVPSAADLPFLFSSPGICNASFSGYPVTCNYECSGGQHYIGGCSLSLERCCRTASLTCPNNGYLVSGYCTDGTTQLDCTGS